MHGIGEGGESLIAGVGVGVVEGFALSGSLSLLREGTSEEVGSGWAWLGGVVMGTMDSSGFFGCLCMGELREL